MDDDWGVYCRNHHFGTDDTWWLIPLSKWVITPVINGISRVNHPLIIGVISHLLSGMSHQVILIHTTDCTRLSIRSVGAIHDMGMS